MSETERVTLVGNLTADPDAFNQREQAQRDADC